MTANSTRTLRLRIVLLAVCAVAFGLLALPAHAEISAASFVVDSTLAKNGTLHVTQTVTFQGAPPAKLTQHLATRENALGDRRYVFEISGVTASSGGKDLTPTVDHGDDVTTITINTSGAGGPVTMAYTVKGAVRSTEEGTALRWQLLQGLSVGVDKFFAVVKVPGGFSHVRCTAGPPNTSAPCRTAAAGTDDAVMPTFTDGPLGPGEVVGVDIGFRGAAVAANERIDYRWTVARAFSAKPLPLGIALGLLVLGGLALYLVHRRRGADASPSPADQEIIKVGEFAAVGQGLTVFHRLNGIRPGQVGTVADERVDPIDVTATILDLAVRGHVLITELPRESEFAAADWSFTRRPSDVSDLRPFEVELLNAIAPEGQEIRVSAMSGRVNDAISDVQSRLYDEVVDRGWYEHRPDATRNTWTQLALISLIVAVAATGVLAAFTTYGLVGLALVALALGLMFVAQGMPARTAKGAALLAGLGVLRSALLTQPTNQMPPGKELHELSEVVPYAVVLGGLDRWLDAIVATDLDEAPDSTDLDWYHGPPNWHLRYLPHSLHNFTTTVSGTLFSR